MLCPPVPESCNRISFQVFSLLGLDGVHDVTV